MKKLLLLLSVVSALFVVSCSTTIGGGTGSTLVGTTWEWGEISDFHIIVTLTSASGGTATLYDGGRVWLIYSITYTMSGANTGSGIISGRDEDGSAVSEPFSFVISGNNMQVIGPDPDTPNEQYTYIFTKQ